MIGWVAPTDFGWFDFLSRRQWEEVNFWTPSDYYAFHGKPGAPFLFKLKRPHNAVAGYGYVLRYDAIPEDLAWEAFGPANGAPTFEAMSDRIRRFREDNELQGRSALKQIGCITLSSPVFLPRELWTPQPTDWPRQNLRMKQYDLTEGEGQRVWAHVLNAGIAAGLEGYAAAPLDDAARWGNPILVRPRLGQAGFRLAVTDAYDRACAITGEHSLPVLDAAHIKPYTLDGPHQTSNGLLLRSDVHRLFDKGYITITPERRIKVSPRLKEHFANGRSYYPMDGQQIRLPELVADHPSPDWLQWHYQHRFMG